MRDIIAAVIAVLLPTFRRRLDALYSAEGKRQALLVETIHGMRTVKALAIEPKQRRTWEQSSAAAINAHYQVGHLGITGGSLTSFLEKILPGVVIVIGAQDVFDQTMTVGALIAFQMISGRVVSPLTQIVGLINEYQQTALSVRMLGEIMNRPPEGRLGAGGLRSTLNGEIVFDNVSFRYPGATTSALDRASFRIPAGAVVGIVGRSGSGKTTLTKLIQGLYPVQEGVVRFDGVDAREIDLADGITRYEHHYNRQHHDHMICMQCGRSLEFYDPAIESLQEEASEHLGFKVLDHKLQIYGVCGDCRR